MSKKMQFSSDQELAISAKGENYLISAGAGSGKTAVLTERIYRIAKEEKTLDKFLVLTFTNLAASEMKNRVRGKLLDDEETLYLATEVDNSHIETFDSFSLYLVKKYFYELGISKDITIVDNSILSIKRKYYLDELFEECYSKEDKDFLSLVDSYVVKNEDAIKDFIITLLEKADKRADNYAYLNHLINDFFSLNSVDSAINDYMKEIKSNLEFIKEKAGELEDADDASQIYEKIDSLLEINSYDELFAVLSDKDKSKFPTKPRGADHETSEDDKEYRAKIAKYYNDKIKVGKDNNYGSKEEILEQYLSIKPYVKTIIDLAIKVENKLDNFKKEHNAYSFGDISRFVLRLLNNSVIKEEISKRFDYIMIDEYQDTNDIQETVVSAISRNNVYMVGDVKQSIYRFRGADCHIFQEKYENYKKGIGGKEIDLNTSYRSRSEVVNFVNELFSQIMVKSINEIDYSNGHHFGFGRKEYDENKPTCSYAPEVYNYSFEKASEAVEKEIDIIAIDILNKIKNKYQVYDPKTKSSRDCSYKDFAIIIDRGGSFDEYRRKFSTYNIPLKVESKEALFKSDVALVIKNLIKMLHYSLIDKYESEYKHAYFSVARSFLFEYRDDTLYDIHVNNTYLNERFAQKIELIKESLRYASIKDVLLKLYEEFDIYSAISRITQYYPNVHKLEHLITLSESMDALGYTLEDFVTYFDDLNAMDQDIDYSDSDSQEDSVTLINIHKSKGLEYSIIYYPGLTKEFNRQDLLTSYLISNTYGAVIPGVNVENSSLFIHLIKEELKKEDFEEKIRLLYVAITRAKEKIIFVNGHKDKGDRLVKPIASKNMQEILSITNVLEKYDAYYSDKLEEVVATEKEKSVNKITIKQIEIPYKERVHLRASKSVNEEIDPDLLDFGTELHAYLENFNLENKSLDYVKNRQMKKYVYNVMHSSLFDGVKNNEVLHEYRFFDEESGIEGYIDALIVKENEIDIVDFKLKNIDEKEYDRQLRIYKSFLARQTKLPIKMYLLAAMTGEIREVKDE